MNAGLLSISVRLPLSPFTLEVDALLQGGVTAILGVSGSGKTSLLETLAGLREPLAASLVLGGRVLEDSSVGYSRPPEERRVGFLPQEVLLFPHLNVRENLQYGFGRGRGGSAPNWESVVGILGLEDLLGAWPGRLSGGEKQRVGLGRALLSGAEWLLLDEPFSSLDGGNKSRILLYLKRIRERFGIPILYVTHDLSHILSFADEALVLDKGRVICQGEPMEVLARLSKQSPWEGGDVENVLEGVVEEHASDRGLTGVRVGDAMLWASAFVASPGDKVQVSFSAEDVMVSVDRPRGLSARNILEGCVEKVIEDGTDLLKVGAGFPLMVRLTRGALRELGLREGCEAYFILKSGSIRCATEGRQEVAP